MFNYFSLFLSGVFSSRTYYETAHAEEIQNIAILLSQKFTFLSKSFHFNLFSGNFMLKIMHQFNNNNITICNVFIIFFCREFLTRSWRVSTSCSCISSSGTVFEFHTGNAWHKLLVGWGWAPGWMGGTISSVFKRHFEKRFQKHVHSLASLLFLDISYRGSGNIYCALMLLRPKKQSTKLF